MSYSAFSLFRRILQQARPFWPQLTGIFLLNILSSPIALLQPVPLKIIVDTAFGDHPLPGFIRFFFPQTFEYSFQTTILLAAALVLIIALLENIHSFINWILMISTGERLVLNFRARLFDQVQRLSLAYHDQKGTSDSLYRIQYDSTAIRQLLVGGLSPLVSSGITVLSMIFVMFLINWRFAIIALSIAPLLLLLTRISSRRLRRGWDKVMEQDSSAMSVVHETLGALRVVKAFGREKKEGERFVEKSDEAVKGKVKMAWIGASFQSLISMIIATGTGLFIYLGAVYVQKGEITIGELIIVMAYLAQIFGPLSSISKTINNLQSSLSSLGRVYSLLDREQEVEETAHPVPLRRVEGSVIFEKVTFSYPGADPVFKEVSFKISPGSKVGILGPTGAGKSTLINLLTRFYDIDSGKILVDGVDIRNYKLSDYRKQFGIVLQEPVLFSTTIAENIGYGRPGASPEEIVAAAKLANAHSFIVNSSEGYDTQVGERGMQLSGGERQRISLARAFIKDAPILILDEPTSSVDVGTEALIMEAIDRLMEGRTTFLITHRLDTLSQCDVLIHMEKGGVKEIVDNHDPSILKRKKESLLKN